MERTAIFKNIEVSFTDSGKGRTLVFLHGFPESKEIWNSFVSPFTKSYRVVTIDLPGFGKTSPIGYVHTMELMAECVKKVMDELGLRKYIIIGHSMGGYVALSFAQLFSKNVSGISLFHSTALADSEEKKLDRSRAVEIVKQNHKRYVVELLPKLFAGNNDQKFSVEVDALKNIFFNTSPLGIINALEGMKLRTDKTSVLKTSHFPIQFIIGKYDKVLPYDTLIEQSKLCKSSHVCLLESSGHIGFIEEPVASQKALRQFFRMCF